MDNRKAKILCTVVEQYIRTGEPVGSKYLADTIPFQVSPATIRNDMVALEEAGYLEQLHTSSGRVPTHSGYRCYIDELMEELPLSRAEQAQIDALFNIRNADPDRLLEEAANALSRLTGLATVSTTIIPATVTVRRVEIIPAGLRTVVIVLIASSGVTRNKVCRVDFEVTHAAVEFFSKFAQHQLVGRSLDAITAGYLHSVSISMGEYSNLFLPVFTALYELVREINEGQYFTKGIKHLLGHSGSTANVYELLSDLEERDKMLRLVADTDQPLQVLIGREAATESLTESAVLIARYNLGQNAAGAIAVIGPVRLDYRRLLPHLAYFAETLGKLLRETYRES